MNVSLDWLADHLDLTGHSRQELDDLLTFAGIEVEGVQAMPDKVVVAQVTSSERHPDADKLSVCRVDDGTPEPRQIVCGAKNYTVGDKVPLALPGADLGGGFKIKKGKLRGVESHGMLCSAKELGRQDDSGLWILPADAVPGTPLAELFPAVFELEITPNRPDCLSHLGVARELAALSDQLLKGKAHLADTETPGRPAAADEVRLDDAGRCPLYTARKVSGVEVKASPAWLRDKLESVGLRPINNVVDITNYVLLETGQPLHAFDQAKLDGGIVVRRAADGEEFLALDGETYALDADDLVIADQGKAVAIAGIMGGEDTGVTGSTTDVLLEAAYFAPAPIRRSGRRLGLSSDSSYRFERGVDPAQVAGASELAVKLILELAGGTAEESIAVAGEVPPPPADVAFDADRCRHLLGHDVWDAEMFGILEKLGLRKASETGATSTWTVPSYRRDLVRPADLYEEIARVYGLDNIPSRTVARFAEVSAADRAHDFAEGIADRLAALGFFEARTLKLTSTSRAADNVCRAEAGAVPLKNPLSDELTHLRPALAPGLVEVAARNIRQGAESLRLFEIGTVFDASGKPEESQSLALLLSGPAPRGWQNPRPEPADLFALKGAVDAATGVATTCERRSETPDGAALAADLRVGKLAVGRIAQLAPARVREIDARHPVFVAELDLGLLLRKSPGDRPVEDLPKFPAVTRDVAVEAPRDLPAGEVERALATFDSPLLASVSLFDLFEDGSGAKLAADKKSLAFTLTYRAADRTLESAEVDALHAEVLAQLRSKLPVEFR